MQLLMMLLSTIQSSASNEDFDYESCSDGSVLMAASFAFYLSG